jgi:hypothetical protein
MSGCVRWLVETVFDLGIFRVFEHDSEPDRELREFTPSWTFPTFQEDDV